VLPFGIHDPQFDLNVRELAQTSETCLDLSIVLSLYPFLQTAGRTKRRQVKVAKTKKNDGLYNKHGKLKRKVYEEKLAELQEELVKLQYWIRDKGLKVVVVFEGRDAAGKGGVIKRITQRLNPRIVRVVALGVPTEKETTQWYFQRYVAHLPAAGEMVLFDRSWYNRALVDRVMGFCTDDQYREFLRSAPEFERMLVRSGIKLIKYWFSVSDAVQEQRFQQRSDDPKRRWKLSPMDLEARLQWVEYSRAKDAMFMYTDIEQAPWYVVNADVKRHARLNCIKHLLSLIDYQDLTPEPIDLPPRQQDTGYVRPPIQDQTWVPAVWGENPVLEER
jgi:polyphosphate kinase 2